MHIEGVCIREGRQASVGEVAAQKAADDVTILEGGASDVEGTDGGADVANIGDSAAQINFNFKQVHMFRNRFAEQMRHSDIAFLIMLLLY